MAIRHLNSKMPNEELDFNLVCETPEALARMPGLFSVTGAVMNDATFVAANPEQAEFISFPISNASELARLVIYEWNSTWEAGQFRGRVAFSELFRIINESVRSLENEAEISLLCEKLAKKTGGVTLAEQHAQIYKFLYNATIENRNIYLMPDSGRHQYFRYSSLYHLISPSNLKRNGLPLLKAACWPSCSTARMPAHLLPNDFDQRLQRAFAQTIWPHLGLGSPLQAYAKDGSLSLLAHNLDFWLPPLFGIIEKILRESGRWEVESETQAKKILRGNSLIPEEWKDELYVARPCHGGPLWEGQEDAEIVLSTLVEHADKANRLRGLIEAFKAHTIEDDFSDRWSFAKEDFERKLYHKRNKFKVTFVELNEAIGVHGPFSEFHDSMLWADFFCLLSPKERRVLIGLQSAKTSLGNVGKMLGYKNHSPVAKALSSMRKKIKEYMK